MKVILQGKYKLTDIDNLTILLILILDLIYIRFSSLIFRFKGKSNQL